MALTDVQIINLALIKMGNGTITSREEASQSARIMTAVYEHYRDAVLKSGVWDRSIKRTTLSPLASTDDRVANIHTHTYGFLLPSDFLALSPQTDVNNIIRIEGEIVVSESSEIKLVYVSSDEAAWSQDPLLVEAVACKLALETCTQFGKESMRNKLTAEYREAMGEGRYQAARQSTGDAFAYDQRLGSSGFHSWLSNTWGE